MPREQAYRVADFDGKIAEKSSGFGSRYAFYANVFDDELFDGLRW